MPRKIPDVRIVSNIIFKGETIVSPQNNSILPDISSGPVAFQGLMGLSTQAMSSCERVIILSLDGIRKLKLGIVAIINQMFALGYKKVVKSNSFCFTVQSKFVINQEKGDFVY